MSLISKPGVADACLFVRDRYGLNVSLVAFCVWVADSGSGSLSTEMITAVTRRIADWEQQVVRPLREIHRSCRHEPLGVPEFLLQTFEPQIETTEREAEQVEQLMLAEFARSLPRNLSEPGNRPVDPVSDAVSSLKAYLSRLEVDQDAQLTECLSVILQAAFSGACFPDAHPFGTAGGESPAKPV